MGSCAGLKGRSLIMLSLLVYMVLVLMNSVLCVRVCARCVIRVMTLESSGCISSVFPVFPSVCPRDSE